MKRGEESVPSTKPSGPTSSASRCVVSPKPQPMSMQRPASGGGKSSKTSSVTSSSAPTKTLRFDFHRSYRTVSHARTASSLASATAPAGCCCVIARPYTQYPGWESNPHVPKDSGF